MPGVIKARILTGCTFFNQIDIYSAGRLLIQRVSYAVLKKRIFILWLLGVQPSTISAYPVLNV